MAIFVLSFSAMEEQSLTASFARDFQMRVGFKAMKTRAFLYHAD
jgi:hypothetical protein